MVIKIFDVPFQYIGWLSGILLHRVTTFLDMEREELVVLEPDLKLVLDTVEDVVVEMVPDTEPLNL